jgi:hypothetical protein
MSDEEKNQVGRPVGKRCRKGRMRKGNSRDHAFIISSGSSTVCGSLIQWIRIANGPSFRVVRGRLVRAGIGPYHLSSRREYSLMVNSIDIINGTMQ